MDYKEKLRLAKEALDSGSYDKKTIEYIFPELKESEDDRIRKALINVFSTHQGYEVFFGASVEDILAWLEKQGKIADEYEDKLDRCACESFDKGYKAALEKQGELKPIAWSEEDEEQLDRALYMMEQLDMTKSWDDVYNWLKSLKDRVLTQPKQEWSEKDEYILKNIHAFIKENTIDPNRVNCAEECLNWLKSLKPNHWKPSEEQIKSLRIALQTMPYSKNKENVLVILEELMKI